MNDLLKLLKWILLTRFFFFALQVLVSIVPDHQHSKTTAFITNNRLPPHPLLIELLFGGFDNWDSEYYLLIADRGYQLKECHAFFPLYPLLMRFLASLLFNSPLGSFIPFHSLLVICGVMISNVSFVVSALLLYILTVKVFSTSVSSSVPLSSPTVPISPTISYLGIKSRPLSLSNTPMTTSSTSIPKPSTSECMTQPMIQEIAFLTVLAYTVNPATVFMSSIYTESIFSFFSLSGMLAISYCQPFLAALLFAGASGTRSNGIVLSGFIIYYHLVSLAKETQTHSIGGMGIRIIVHVTTMFLQLLLVLIPFITFQMYSYSQFCPPTSGNVEFSLLCNSSLPLPYSFVQGHYWKLGLLKFYELKQIPHFMFATPMFILAGNALWRYYNIITNNITKCLNQRGNSDQLCIDFTLLPYMVQLLFLLLTAALFMYIQVVTRFICSSSPVVFWFTALVFLRKGLDMRRDGSVGSYLKQLVYSCHWAQPIVQYELKQWIVIYFVSYNVLGFVMHCNFLPWV